MNIERATSRGTEVSARRRNSRHFTGICRAAKAREWLLEELDHGMDLVEHGKTTAERERGLRKMQVTERQLIAGGVLEGPAQF